MHVRQRELLALRAAALCAGAIAPVAVAAAGGPEATQSGPRDPRGDRGPGGDRPDPRCRSIEQRLEGAQQGVGQAQVTLRQANRRVAAKRAALRRASGRSAKARAERQLRAAKRAQRAASGDVRSAKARLESLQRQASAFDCAT